MVPCFFDVKLGNIPTNIPKHLDNVTTELHATNPFDVYGMEDDPNVKAEKNRNSIVNVAANNRLEALLDINGNNEIQDEDIPEPRLENLSSSIPRRSSSSAVDTSLNTSFTPSTSVSSAILDTNSSTFYSNCASLLVRFSFKG